MKAFVVVVLLILSHAVFNKNNLKQNENFKVSEVEIEDFFKTTVEDCFNFYKEELNSKKYMIKSLDHLHDVAFKSMDNVLTRFNKEVTTFKIDKNFKTMTLSLNDLVNINNTKYKTKLKEKLQSFYVTLKNQFAEEFELSEKETNLIKNFYKANAKEVLGIYDEQVADFIQNKPSKNELVFFLRNLKDSLLTKYEHSIFLDKISSSFKFKLLNPNESQIKNEILTQLYKRMNKNSLNANIQEENSPIKTKKENFLEFTKHGYFYTVINGLFTVVFYLYWIFSLSLSIDFFIDIISGNFKNKLCIMSFLFALTICTLMYFIQLFKYPYTFDVAHVCFIILVMVFNQGYASAFMTATLASKINRHLMIFWVLYSFVRTLTIILQLIY